MDDDLEEKNANMELPAREEFAFFSTLQRPTTGRALTLPL